MNYLAHKEKNKNSSKIIRLSKSIVGRLEAAEVTRVIVEDGYLGMGREVQLFEKEIAEFLGVSSDYVVCVNTGTSALHLAVQAVTAPGDEVIVPSLTYIATFQAISAARANPLACEVKPQTVTLDLEDAARRVTPKTKVIMPVHYAGNPGNLDSVYNFANKYGLRVIEDAAHAFGTTYKGMKIGSSQLLNHLTTHPRNRSTTQLDNQFGIVCFSFDGIKNITSGEGGAVVTKDSKVAQRIRDARMLGVQKDTEKRYQGERSWNFDVSDQGYRYHMSNLFAALGRVQLKRFENEFKPRRIEIAQKYRSAFKNLKGIVLLKDESGEIVPFIFPIRVLDSRRNALLQFLNDKGIECGIHYKPNHLLSYYGARKGMLPVTEKLYNELLSLPLHPGLTEEEQDYVIDCVVKWSSK